jgi:hypothetical protein
VDGRENADQVLESLPIPESPIYQFTNLPIYQSPIPPPDSGNNTGSGVEAGCGDGAGVGVGVRIGAGEGGGGVALTNVVVGDGNGEIGESSATVAWVASKAMVMMAIRAAKEMMLRVFSVFTFSPFLTGLAQLILL